MSSKFEIDVELKSSAEKIWESIGDIKTVFLKAFPHEYESIEIIGDGKSPGSVRILHYKPGFIVTSVTEKIELTDDANKTQIFSITEGDILKEFKNYRSKFVVTPNGEGSLMKVFTEFDKANDKTPNPDFIIDFLVKKFKDLDAYLMSAHA